jgi:hypothetical protein
MAEFWGLIGHVVRKADIILMVIDARMPDMSRNLEIEELVKQYDKKLVYVFNKIDLVDRRQIQNIKKKFAGEDMFFVSGVNNIGMSKLKDGLFIIASRFGIELPHIGVVGYPNVGKSAIINALSKRAKTNVSSHAGTTRGIQWVKAGKLRIMDSPGVIPSRNNSEAEMGVLGARDPERLKNPDLAALEIIRILLEKNKKRLESFYEIKINEESGEEIIEMIGRSRGFLKRGGIVDENRTVVNIIHDWQKGKLRV